MQHRPPLMPTVEPAERLGDEPFDPVTFDAYLFDRGSFKLRDTDGATRVSAALEGGRLVVEAGGAKEGVGLRPLPLPGAAEVTPVVANGTELQRWERDREGSIRAMIDVG